MMAHPCGTLCSSNGLATAPIKPSWCAACTCQLFLSASTPSPVKDVTSPSLHNTPHSTLQVVAPAQRDSQHSAAGPASRARSKGCKDCAQPGPGSYSSPLQNPVNQGHVRHGTGCALNTHSSQHTQPLSPKPGAAPHLHAYQSRPVPTHE